PPAWPGRRRPQPAHRAPAPKRRPGDGPAAGGAPEPRRSASLLAQPATREVVTGQRAGLRLPEVPLVERRGRVEQLEQPLAATPPRILPRRALLPLELDVEALGEPRHGVGEVEVLRLAHELDRVAPGPAA